MIKNFCHLCGTKLIPKADGVWRCDGCDSTIYGNPKPCADIALFNAEGKLLISKRALDPEMGKFDLPGGFVELNETIEQALAREIEEELGLAVGDYTEPVFMASRIHKYPYGKDVYDNLVFMFVARLHVADDVVRPNDDVAAVEFRTRDEINRAEVVGGDYYDYMMRAFAMNQSLES